VSGLGLRALPVPAGVAALSILDDLRRALDGTGPAIAPHAVNSIPQSIPDDLSHLPDGLALTIGTSGSTGRPKLAMLTSAALRASANATHDRLGGQGQWLLTMPANNLRDIPIDRAHGKQTLAVHLGDAGTRKLYAALLAISLACVVVVGVTHPSALIALLSFVLAFPLLRRVLRGATGRDLVPVLSGTGRFELVYAALFAFGLGPAQHLG